MQVSQGFSADGVFEKHGNKMVETKSTQQNRKIDVNVLNNKKGFDIGKRVTALKDMKQMTEAMVSRCASEGTSYSALNRYQYQIQNWEIGIDRDIVEDHKSHLKSEGSLEEKLLFELKNEREYGAFLDKVFAKNEISKSRFKRKKLGWSDKAYVMQKAKGKEGKWIKKEKEEYETNLHLLFSKVLQKYDKLVEKSEWNLNDETHTALTNLVDSLKARAREVSDDQKGTLKNVLDSLLFYRDYAKDKTIKIKDWDLPTQQRTLGKETQKAISHWQNIGQEVLKEEKRIDVMAKVFPAGSQSKESLLGQKVCKRRKEYLLLTKPKIQKLREKILNALR